MSEVTAGQVEVAAPSVTKCTCDSCNKTIIGEIKMRAVNSECMLFGRMRKRRTSECNKNAHSTDALYDPREVTCCFLGVNTPPITRTNLN